MGVTFSHGEVDAWTHGNYNNFLRRLAAGIGIDLDQMEGWLAADLLAAVAHGERTVESTDGLWGTRPWNEVHDPIKPLLTGQRSIAPAKCGKTAQRLRELVQDWPEDAAHDSFGTFDKQNALRLADALAEAAGKGEIFYIGDADGPKQPARRRRPARIEVALSVADRAWAEQEARTKGLSVGAYVRSLVLESLPTWGTLFTQPLLEAPIPDSPLRLDLTVADRDRIRTVAQQFGYGSAATLVPHIVHSRRVAAVQSPVLLPPPAVLADPGQPLPADHLVLAEATAATGQPRLVAIPRANLRGWGHIAGRCGTGKTMLLTHWGQQHLANGWGLGVIDDKGDLVRGLALRVPLAREGEVVWFYPGQMLREIVINPLERPVQDSLGPEFLAEMALAVWSSLVRPDWWLGGWPNLSPDEQAQERKQRRLVLDYGIRAVAEGSDTPSFLELLRFLDWHEGDEKTPSFHDQVVGTIRDPLTCRFWQQEAVGRFRPPAHSWNPDPLGYALETMQVWSRLLAERLVRNPATRYLLGLPASSVSFHFALESTPIVLAAVPDALGEARNAIGTLLYHWLLGAVLYRVSWRGDHPDFTLLVDGFPAFVPENRWDPSGEQADLLRQARIAVILASQSTAQVAPAMLSALMDSPNRVVFSQIAEQDARLLVGNWAATLTPVDLTRLQTRQREVYISCAEDPDTGHIVGPFSARTLLPAPVVAEALGVRPAAPFTWPEREEYDALVNELAALEERLWVAQEQRDRETAFALRRQGVERLQALVAQGGGAAYRAYVARRRARDQAAREFLLAHPAGEPDKLARIKRLSALAYGVPEFEAEYELGQAIRD